MMAKQRTIKVPKGIKLLGNKTQLEVKRWEIKMHKKTKMGDSIALEKKIMKK